MPELVLPKLHESLLNEEWYKSGFDMTVKKAQGNPWINQYMKMGMKEGILSDMAAALGRIHDVVVEAAKPNLIGREIIDTQSTSESLERYPLAKKSIAYVASEGGTIRVYGERYSTVDIQTNIIIKDAAEWTREFAEDAKWNVMNRQLRELGRSVAQKESEQVIALFAGISAGDLAGGAALAGGGTVLDWTQTVAHWDAIENEDFGPADTFVLHPKQVSQLFTKDQFINSQYLPSGPTGLARGLIGQALTMKIYKSTLCTNGTAHALNKSVAGVLLIRRDITTEPYDDPKNGVFGIVASERIGLGILRSKAVARMTNIKTTLT